MIKCGRCGNLNAGDVLFCQYCGTRLVEQRLPDVAVGRGAPQPASNRSTDRLIEQSAHAAGHPGTRRPPAAHQAPCAPLAAAVRVRGRPADGLPPGRRPPRRHRRHHLQPARATRSTSAAPRATCCSRILTWRPRHARIVASLTGRVLTPLETRNGVYVRLRGAVDLQDGDYVLMGKQVLRFETVSEPERNVRPAIEHGVVVFGTPGAAALGPAPADHPGRGRPGHLPPHPAGHRAGPGDRRHHILRRRVHVAPARAGCRSATGAATWRTWGARTERSCACADRTASPRAT